MNNQILSEGSYEVTVQKNRITTIEPIADGDELLGIEWAISEIKDSMKHKGHADGGYGVSNLIELRELMDYLSRMLGEEAVATWRACVNS
jgi:hypothetical protein